ncbi:MAG: hypothetical protein ACYC9S_00250 [Leptospirales bacterium]
MFKGSPEEWEREWRFKERLQQIESLLVHHREALDAVLEENRRIKKENQRLVRTLSLLKRERERVRGILRQVESKLAGAVGKGKRSAGEKEA